MDFGFVHHFDGANWTRNGVGVGGIDAIWRGGAVLWLAESTLANVNGPDGGPESARLRRHQRAGRGNRGFAANQGAAT